MTTKEKTSHAATECEIAHVNSNRDILIDDTTGIYEWSDEPIPNPQTAATPHGERR